MEYKGSIHQITLIQHVFKLIKTPVLVALLLTPIRYVLELIGLPEHVIFIIGLLWLTLGFSIYWGVKLYHEKRSYYILLLCLVIFSPISRIPVAIMWWVDTTWKIGTHYGLYYDSWLQALLNHLVYGSLVQIIPGILLGATTIALMKYRNSKNI